MSRSKLGSIRKLPSGSWLARVKHKGDSRSGTYATEHEAKLAVARMALELGKPSPKPSKVLTVGEYYYEYYMPMHMANGTAKSTMKLYESSWNAHVSRYANTPIDKLSRVEIKRWLLSIPTHGARNNSYKLLRQILNAAMDDEIIETHPLLRSLKLAAPRKQRPVLWDKDQVMHAIDHIWLHPVASKYLPLVLVMVGGGLRREEGLALTRENLAFIYDERGCTCIVDISRAWVKVDGMKDTKTSGSTRTVVIGEPFSSMLDQVAPEYGWIVAGKDFVLPANPTRCTAVWRSLFKEHGGELDLPYITLYQLRATHATLMQAAAIEDTVISAAHGHTQLSTDYKHYLSPDIGIMVDASNRLADYLSS